VPSIPAEVPLIKPLSGGWVSHVSWMNSVSRHSGDQIDGEEIPSQASQITISPGEVVLGIWTCRTAGTFVRPDKGKVIEIADLGGLHHH